MVEPIDACHHRPSDTCMTNSSIHPAAPLILTINGGSSSIRFALFEAGNSFSRLPGGQIERIGLPMTLFRAKGVYRWDNFSRSETAPDHMVALGILMDWIEGHYGSDAELSRSSGDYQRTVRGRA